MIAVRVVQKKLHCGHWAELPNGAICRKRNSSVGARRRLSSWEDKDEGRREESPCVVAKVRQRSSLVILIRRFMGFEGVK